MPWHDQRQPLVLVAGSARRALETSSPDGEGLAHRCRWTKFGFVQPEPCIFDSYGTRLQSSCFKPELIGSLSKEYSLFHMLTPSDSLSFPNVVRIIPGHTCGFRARTEHRKDRCSTFVARQLMTVLAVSRHLRQSVQSLKELSSQVERCRSSQRKQLGLSRRIVLLPSQYPGHASPSCLARH